MAGMTSAVVNVNGAFLHEDIEDGEEIYMEVPRSTTRIEWYSD